MYWYRLWDFQLSVLISAEVSAWRPAKFLTQSPYTPSGPEVFHELLQNSKAASGSGGGICSCYLLSRLSQNRFWSVSNRWSAWNWFTLTENLLIFATVDVSHCFRSSIILSIPFFISQYLCSISLMRNYISSLMWLILLLLLLSPIYNHFHNHYCYYGSWRHLLHYPKEKPLFIEWITYHCMWQLLLTVLCLSGCNA